MAIVLHWLMAALILFMLGLGYYMAQVIAETDPRRFDLVQLHKSFGVTLLILSLVRLAWRFGHPPPPLPAPMPEWEKRAARAVHWIFYGLMIGVPLLGWAVASASPLGLPTLVFGLFEWPHLPFLAELSRVEKANAVVPIRAAHAALAYAMAGLLALHVAAALKHTFWDREDVLARILPRVRKGLILAVAVTAAGGLKSAPAVAADWAVDHARSTLRFVGQWSGEPFGGTFQEWRAEIRFDPDDLAGSRALVRIDLASMTSDEGETELETGVRGPQGFHVAMWPEARFETTGFRVDGPGRYTATGLLTIKGMTREISLPFTFMRTGGTAHVTGRTTVMRTDFGVGTGIWQSETPVAHAVDVIVDIVAVEQP